MQVGQFPASAANSLIQGYCDDFVSLAAVLAQTLEQISMRGIKIDASRASLQRIENGMRNLAEAIHELLERGKVDGDLRSALDAAPTPPATPAPARAATAPAAVATPPRAAVGAAPRPGLGTATLAPSPVRAPAAASMRPPVAAPAAAAQRPAAPAGENLSGTSQSMPLLSVFQFLGRMRKAGVMRVRLGTEDLLFELQNGCITATASSHCPHQEQLDELLVERGACVAEDLDPVVGRVPPAQTERFAEAALAAGAVSEAQVLDALALQQNRRYTRVCRSQDARYEFVEGARQKHDGRLRPPPMPIA